VSIEDELKGHAEMMNWRIIAYGLTASAMIISGAFLAWMVSPNVSRPEHCAKACGGRMKSFTEGVPAHWSPVKVEDELLGKKFTTEKQVMVEAVPEKCECQEGSHGM
jgi:hypothetical protein